jgi:hypothetical protein
MQQLGSSSGAGASPQAGSFALSQIQLLGGTVNQLRAIEARVRGLLHEFVASEYYLVEFTAVAATFFEMHEARLDAVLRDRAADVLKKVPIIYARLTEGDEEAVSQALTTCRRIIDGFADAVLPPRAEPIVEAGNTIELGADKTLNRINVYVAERTSSDSRRDRMRRTLGDLYKRVNAGVHSDVTRDEAMSLFLQTYLLLGEIAMLPTPTIDPVK